MKKKVAPVVLAGISQKYPVPYDISSSCVSPHFIFKIWVNSVCKVFSFFTCYNVHIFTILT